MYLVDLVMSGGEGVSYVARRTVTASDPDEACALGMAQERARQAGVIQAGGILHGVSHVARVRRVPGL